MNTLHTFVLLPVAYDEDQQVLLYVKQQGVQVSQCWLVQNLPNSEGLGSGALKTCLSFPAGTYRPPCVSMMGYDDNSANN